MLPDIEQENETYDKLIELLEGRRIAISVGVNDNLLLIAFGEDAQLIEKIGKNTSRLLDAAPLQILKSNTPERLRSIGYASERFRGSYWNANFGHYFENLAQQLAGALSDEAEAMPELDEWRGEMLADARWLDDRMRELTPEFGPTLSWSYAVEGGLEGYAHDWTENLAIENAQPMTILQHSGDHTLINLGLKQRELPGMQTLVEYVLDKAPGHVRRFIEVAQETADDRESALLALDRGWPLLRDAYAILRDKIGPALAERESVFSLAAEWTTTDVGPFLPASATPLPLPEMGLACKLNDRELFLEGCRDLYSVFDDYLELVREINPQGVPPGYSIPRPDEEALANGTRYYYAELSNQVPLDGFEPQVLVGDDTVVVTYSMRQADDMLTANARLGLPAWMDAESPVAAVSKIDFAGLVQMVRPWVEYGFAVNEMGLDSPLAEGNGPIPTPNDVLQIWDTLTELGQAQGTATINADGDTISRWRWVNTP